MPDIGTLFPDTDPQYLNVCSINLLQIVLQRIKRNGWQVAQMDSIIITDLPRLAPFVAPNKKKSGSTVENCFRTNWIESENH